MNKSGCDQTSVGKASVFTHNYPEETGAAIGELVRAAQERETQLIFSPEEVSKHGLRTDGDIIHVSADADVSPDVCIVLGGDGTILYALKKYLGKNVPVFAINYGRIGFLAAVERENLDQGLELSLSGQFEKLPLPALAVSVGDCSYDAINDVAFHRLPERRVAQLTYLLGGERIGDVRCDGLVVATAVGSTGYNLANGGPILAWGVEGYVISFIAPHTLTARPLLAAAKDVMTVRNESTREAVAISIDGRGVAELAPGAEAYVTYSDQVAQLAQLPGTNFYNRFRDKFV